MDGTVSVPNPSATMTCAHPASTQFTLDSTALSQATGLYLKTHGIQYSTQASFQINGSPWVRIKNTNTSATINQDNPTVTFFGNIAAYGGIGGVYTIIRMEIPLSTPTIGSAATLGKYLQAGTNTMNFCFNGTDSRKSGYRVVDLNLYNSSGAPVTLASGAQAIVTYEDNTGWTTVPSDGDAANGQTIYTTRTLIESSVSSNTTILAHCSDCHTDSGSDLRYFNYSNFSIRQRAIFHGITADQDLDDLVAYIRSLNVADVTEPSQPAPGRPWWPPYQPGPGLDAKPTSYWAAGAGDTAILDDDSQTLPYFPGSGQSVSNLVDPETGHVVGLGVHEIPIAFPLLDWNHWVPAVFPADALGSVATFQGEAAYQDLQSILSTLTTVSTDKSTLANYLVNTFLYNMNNWDADLSTLGGVIGSALWSTSHLQAFDASYDVALWGMVKDWEIHQNFSLEDYGHAMVGTHAETREWYDAGRFIFGASPHLSGYVDYADSTAGNPALYPIFGDIAYLESLAAANPNDLRLMTTNVYLDEVWYEAQMIMDHGDNSYFYGGHGTIDWGYMNGMEDNLYLGIGTNSSSTYGNTMQPMMSAKFAYTSLYEHDTAVPPTAADFFWTQDAFNHDQSSNDAMATLIFGPVNNSWNDNPQYANILSNYYQIWLQKLGLLNIDDWPTWTSSFDSDGQTAQMYNGAVSTGSVIQNRQAEFTILQTVYKPCTTGACAGLPIAGALLNDYIRWASILWPGPSGTPNNWTQYELPSANVAAPTDVLVTPGVGTATVQWNTVSGATSYNVKRTIDPTKPGLTIAFFVTGTSFVDDKVLAGTPYYYSVSANVDVAGVTNHFGSEEGPDSAVVSVTPAGGLIASWAFNSSTATANQVIPNSVTSVPMSGTAIQIMQDASSLNAPYYMSVDDNLNQWLSQSATVTAYVTVQPAALSGSFSGGGIVGGSSFGVYNAFGVVDPSNGKIEVIFNNGCSSSGDAPLLSSASIADGKQHFVAMSRNASTGVMEISVDGGTPVSSTGCTGDFGANRIYNIGRVDSTAQTFPGVVSNISIYNTAYQGSALQALQ
jgi:hypothetical protein